MIYLFKNPNDESEIHEVVMGMNDEKKYEVDGVKWDRVWTVPQVSSTTKIDPFSQNAFLEKTNNVGTVGDLMDRSKELSEMRKEKSDNGVDPLKMDYYDKYAAARNGRRHIHDPRPPEKKSLKQLNKDAESKKEKRKT